MSRKQILAKFLFFIIILLDSSFADAKISEEEITEFMGGYASVMNRRNAFEIESFFQSNALPNARFVKNNTLVFPDGSEPEVKENFDMNTSEYVEYLKKILIRHDVYRFTYQINKIEIMQDNAFVNFSVSEYYSKSYKEASGPYQLQNLTSANCTITLSTLNSQILIFGSNCLEKITKKKVIS